MRKALKVGEFLEGQFTEGSEEYFKQMGKCGTYVDGLFLKQLARYLHKRISNPLSANFRSLNRDVVILPVHPESCLLIGQFTWIRGFLLLFDVRVCKKSFKVVEKVPQHLRKTILPVNAQYFLGILKRVISVGLITSRLSPLETMRSCPSSSLVVDLMFRNILI